MSGPPTLSGLPSRRGKWLSRTLLWVPLLIAATVAGAVGYEQRQDLPGFINDAGNTASVAGLLVSLVGFWWTLWTVWETRQAGQDAERRLAASVETARKETERAVAEARKDTREAVEKIALQLLQEECDAAYHLIRDGTQAALEKKWERSLDKSQEGQKMIIRLAGHASLLPAEKDECASGTDNLRLTINHVQGCLLANDPTAELPGARWKPLLNLLARIEAIRTRMRSNVLEVPRVN